MTAGRLFLSYSAVDGAEFALQLADALEAGPPSYPVWLDRRDLRPGRDWDEQVADALRSCQGLLFVMTEDSVRAESACKQEWSRVLKYKKPVIPLRLDAAAEMPFRLGSRQYIDFEDFTSGLARLRKHLAWTSSPEGLLAELRLTLADARRQLPRTAEARRSVVEAEIQDLQRRIDESERLINNPPARSAQTRSGSGAAKASGQRPPVRRSADYVAKSAPERTPDRRLVANSAPSITSPDATEDQLEALGLFNRVGMDAHILGAELVAGSIVLDSSICDYQGVDLSNIVVHDVGPLESIGSHPDFISADQMTSIEPTPNRPKAHLTEWHAPVIDQGDVVTLELARSDYWTSEATKRTLPRIQADVVDGQLDLMRLPRRLDVHLVVVTDVDNMLLLARRGSHVATEPSTWMISVGESMDWEYDLNADGVPHPTLTARRCLSDRDELNLPLDLAESADFRLVAIATEWSEMLVNLIVVARIPNISHGRIRHHFRRGENSQLDAVPFTLDSCAALLGSDTFAGSNGRGQETPISDISRLALLAALRSVNPLPEIIRSASTSTR